MRVPCAAVAIACLLGNERVPDRVELSSGSHLEGRVVYEDASHVLLRTGNGEKRIERKDIKSVRSRARLHREAFDRWMASSSDDVASILELARSCQGSDLLEDARLFAAYVLLLDRGNEEAHRLLEHKKAGSIWKCPAGKDQWIAFEKLLATRPDWDDAVEIASAHYTVRTNFGLEHAVQTALDLECFYRAFFDLFGPDVELHEVLEPMLVEIHADRKSFPPLVGDRRAYTEPTRNAVQIDGSSGLRIEDLFHEATHQLIAAQTRLSFSGRGAVPGWLEEGLAEYMRAGLGGLPGRRTFSAGSKVAEHFAVHAAARSPYDLSRVLAFDADDFLASSRADLKYAQAYTLVQLCLEGEEGRFRAGFGEFLRSVWRGRGAPGDFRKAMGIGEAAFEKAWLAHTRPH